MHWKPDPRVFDHHDPRLDEFRDRVGELTTLSGEPFATVVLDSWVFVRQVGGCLWWRRWCDPVETFHGHIIFSDGEYNDWVDHSIEGALEDVVQWRNGEFRYLGETYRVEWLEAKAASAARKHLLDGAE